MANQERRGNREKKKPKAIKPNAPLQATPFARPGVAAAVKGTGGKKGK